MSMSAVTAGAKTTSTCSNSCGPILHPGPWRISPSGAAQPRWPRAEASRPTTSSSWKTARVWSLDASVHGDEVDSPPRRQCTRRASLCRWAGHWRCRQRRPARPPPPQPKRLHRLYPGAGRVRRRDPLWPGNHQPRLCLHARKRRPDQTRPGVVLKTIKKRAPQQVMEEKIKDALANFTYKEIGRRPMVLPLVMEV